MPLQPFRLPGPSTPPLSSLPLSPFHDTSSPILLSPLRASSFSDSFNFKLSIEAPGPVRTFNLFSCGCPLTRIDAKVARVKLKSFICHSYEKHPGVGYSHVRPILGFHSTVSPATECARPLPGSPPPSVTRHPSRVTGHKSPVTAHGIHLRCDTSPAAIPGEPGSHAWAAA